jgi:hypothetical protein
LPDEPKASFGVPSAPKGGAKKKDVRTNNHAPTTADDTAASRPRTSSGLPPRRGGGKPTVALDLPREVPRHAAAAPAVDRAESASRFLVPRDLLDVVANASRAITFPLFLTLVLAMFLLVQDRIDRKDPKLAEASKTKDYLTFD